MHNFLIQESAFSAAPVIQKKNPNTVEFIAVLQEADRPNRNGRIYYKTVLEQALQSPYVQERLRTNSFYGEAGHPSDTSVQRQMTIDQRNIAFLIKEFWWEGNLLKARLETANTSIGRDMKGLIEQGSRVAFSLRAQGNVHHDHQLNATIVEAPIQIATYDWVVNPSHDRAFMESLCEDTMCSMFGVKESKSLVLAESVKLFESGRIIALNEVTQAVVNDYAKNYWKKVKPLAEAYVYDPKDKLVVAEKVATVQNDNVTKKVVLEDFLLKDIRHRILKLTEEGEAAAQPVATSEAPAKEHTPVADNKDILKGQHAEEVKEVVVEAEKTEELNNAHSDTINKQGHIEDPSKKEEKKAESEDVTIKEELGDAAAQPVATSEEQPKEHTPEVKPEEVHAGEQKAEEVKAPIIEAQKPFGPEEKTPVSKASPEQIEKLKGYVKEVEKEMKGEKKELKEELGDAAAQPVATSNEKPVEHTPEVEQSEVHAGEQKAEEVKEVVVESKHSKPEHKEKSEKGEKHSLKEGDPTDVEIKPGEVEVELPAEDKKEEPKDEKHFEAEITNQAGEEQKVEVKAENIQDAIEKVMDGNDVPAENVHEIEHKEDKEEEQLPDVSVGDSSVKVEVPMNGSEMAEMGEEEKQALGEAYKQIRKIVSGKKINEDEAVKVESGADATVKVEGDKIVVEIPVEAPKQEITDKEGEELAEAVSALAFILRK